MSPRVRSRCFIHTHSPTVPLRMQILCLLAALVATACGGFVPTYGSYVPAPVYAGAVVHHTPVTPTVHNVATPFGYRTTGVSYSHRYDAHPLRLRYTYGLSPYGLNYGYGLNAFGYHTLVKKW